MRIVQISDTHISHLGGVTTDNFSRLVEFVNDELHPDLIVNSGDVSILTPDSEADREAAYKLHQCFNAPVAVLPGNHDLGEPGDHPWMGLSVTSGQFRRHVRLRPLRPAGRRKMGHRRDEQRDPLLGATRGRCAMGLA